jgi:hypothetical protein
MQTSGLLLDLIEITGATFRADVKCYKPFHEIAHLTGRFDPGHTNFHLPKIRELPRSKRLHSHENPCEPH